MDFSLLLWGKIQLHAPSCFTDKGSTGKILPKHTHTLETNTYEENKWTNRRTIAVMAIAIFWKVTLDVARRALILFRVLSSKELDGYGPLLSCRNDKLLKFKLWKAKKDRYTHTHTLTYTYTQTEHSLTSVCTCTHRLPRGGLKSTTAMWKGDI